MTVPVEALRAPCEWCGKLQSAAAMDEISVVRIAVDESTQAHKVVGFACQSCSTKVRRKLEQTAHAMKRSKP